MATQTHAQNGTHSCRPAGASVSVKKMPGAAQMPGGGKEPLGDTAAQLKQASQAVGRRGVGGQRAVALRGRGAASLSLHAHELVQHIGCPRKEGAPASTVNNTKLHLIRDGSPSAGTCLHQRSQPHAAPPSAPLACSCPRPRPAAAPAGPPRTPGAATGPAATCTARSAAGHPACAAGRPPSRRAPRPGAGAAGQQPGVLARGSWVRQWLIPQPHGVHVAAVSAIHICSHTHLEPCTVPCSRPGQQHKRPSLTLSRRSASPTSASTANRPAYIDVAFSRLRR